MMATAHEPPVATPPIANVEAEAGLLGALMSENSLIDTIAERVAPEQFYEAVHGRIFSAIVKERALGRAANPVTLRPYFADDEQMKELGGPGYLAQLTGSGASVLGARDFAEQIVELFRRRTLLDALQRIAFNDYEKSFAQIVAEAESAIAEAERSNDDGSLEINLGAAMRQALEGGDQVEGITCGIEPIDNVLGPIKPQELVIVAGRPGMGKTIVLLNYALGVVRARDVSVDPEDVTDGVLIISREMSALQLAQRAAADLCFDGTRGINYEAIKTRRLDADQKRAVARASLRLEALPIEIVDVPRMSVSRLNSTVRRWKRRMAARGITLKLVIIDYLQLLDADHREKDLYTRITEVSKGCKSAAKANDVAVMAAAQLSRDVEKRGEDKRPSLADLRDSGQIEQDADGVMFLYRPGYYHKKKEPHPQDPKHDEWQTIYDRVRHQIEFIVAKRREKEEGVGRGTFYGAFQAVR